MTLLPANLALTNIAPNAAILSADHRTNYSAIQVYANAMNALLGGGTAGQLLASGGAGALSFVAAPVSYRKTTAKTVNTTVAATDLLNGEITVAAGVMGTTGLLRLTAWGSMLQNSGGAVAPPRFQLVLGGTTILDTGTAGTIAANATAMGWRLTAEILNLGAANAQSSRLQFDLEQQITAVGQGLFTTGIGLYFSGASFGGYGQWRADGSNFATAVDTATAKTLVLNVINGSASATYETKLLGALVEIL